MRHAVTAGPRCALPPAPTPVARCLRCLRLARLALTLLTLFTRLARTKPSCFLGATSGPRPEPWPQPAPGPGPEPAPARQVAVERVERQLSGEGSAMAAVLERLDGVRELIERNT